MTRSRGGTEDDAEGNREKKEEALERRLEFGFENAEGRNEVDVKTIGIVRFTMDPKRPPTLSRKAKARLAVLPDDRIDLTDIPATHGVAGNTPAAAPCRPPLPETA